MWTMTVWRSPTSPQKRAKSCSRVKTWRGCSARKANSMPAVRFAGRAELRVAPGAPGHVELWPVGTGDATGGATAASTGIGLPAHTYAEAVVIDRVGLLQLTEEALARVRLATDHVELWPQAVSDVGSASW